MRFLILAGLVAAGVLGQETSKVEDLAPMLREVMEREKQPAIAAAVIRSEGVVARGIVGKRRSDAEEPVADDDPWHLGSETKALTATVIATLVAEGKLSFDLVLADAFKEFAGEIHEDYRSVSLADLLRHRGGLPSFTDGGAAEFAATRGMEGTPAEQRATFTRRVLRAEPKLKPGTKMLYSNAGYGIAAAIAEKAAGVSYEVLVKERLFIPLGMKHSGFGWPATEAHRARPFGHWKDGKGGGLEVVEVGHPYRLPACLAPAGDVHASIDDFSAFVRAHLAGLRGKDGILQAAEWKRLHHPVDGYAMGWGVTTDAGRTVSRHDGSAGTFYARMWIDPASDFAVVITTNAGTGDGAADRVLSSLRKKFAR